MSEPRLGVALTGHWLPLRATRELAQLADRLGYELILVDGDAAALPRRKDAALYDAGALAGVVLMETTRARIGSIRLPGFENPALLARQLSTLQDASRDRAIGFFGVGAGRNSAALGLPRLTASQRIRYLDETLDAVRALLRGERVTRRGRFVRLDEATCPQPRQPVPLVVAAARPGALEVVARRADVWDANVPPIPDLLASLRQHLPRPIETWIWVFGRPDATLDEAGREYRRLCPWFDDVPDAQLAGALLCGDPATWPGRLAELRYTLDVSLPILDLTGLDEAEARRAIEAAAPAEDGDLS